MAMSSNDSTPTFFIYRDTRPGEPFDPTSPPVFFPPKDSDELFDALRAKYPNVKTHSERMRDAIIDFLLEERQNEQTQASPDMPSTSTAATSPWQQSWPSVSASTLSSPETVAIMTPMPGNSPQWQPQAFPVSSAAAPVSSTTSTTSSPPGLEQMTSVFSLSSSEQPKQRIRRKMTEAEKAEYRQRRIVKACEKCAKRKRKCHHNQPEVADLTAKASKVTKPSNTSSKAAFEIVNSSKAREQSYDIRESTDPPEIWTSELQSLDEFTTLLDDNDFDMSGLFPLYQSPSEQEWPWQMMEDLPLFDDVNTSLQYSTNAQQSDSIEPIRLFGDIPQVSNRPVAAAAGSIDNGRFAPSLAGSGYGGALISPTQTGLFGRATLIDTEWGRHPQSGSLGNETGALRGQPGPVEQPQPQHTAHAHEFYGEGAFMDDGQIGGAFAPDLSSDKPIHRFTRATTDHTRVPGSSGGRPVGAQRSLSQTRSISPSGTNTTSDIRSGQLQSEVSLPRASRMRSNGRLTTVETVDTQSGHTGSRLKRGKPRDETLPPAIETGSPEAPQTLPRGLGLNRAPGSSGSMLQNKRSSGAASGPSSLSLGGTSLDGVEVPITGARLVRARQTVSTTLQAPTPLLQTRGEPSTTGIRDDQSSVPSNVQFSLWSSANNNSPSEPTSEGTFLETSWVPVVSQKSDDEVPVHLYKNQRVVRSFESGLHVFTCERSPLTERMVLATVSLLGCFLLASAAITLANCSAVINPSLVLLAVLCPLSGAEISTAPSSKPHSRTLAKNRSWLGLSSTVASTVLCH